MKPSETSPRLKYSKRLNQAAIVTAAAGIGTASAAVQSVDLNVPTVFGGGFASFDPVSGDYEADYNTSYAAGIRNCGLNLLNFDTVNFQWAPTILIGGETVDSSLAFNSNASNSLAYPGDGETVHFGYRYMNQGPGNDETYYGYITVTGGPSSSFTVDTYRYEDSPGTSLTVVPEPAALPLLLGAAGMFGLIRRRP